MNEFAVNGSQMIVPVRFKRAAHGPPLSSAPEPDDRAWRSPHFSTWTDPGIRGPLLGVTKDATVKIKIVREHLNSTATLFVTTRLPAGAGKQIEIVNPTGGNHVAADDHFELKGVANSPNPGAGNIVEARLGSVTGPILAECEVRVFSPLLVFVFPHVCVIHTAVTGPPAAGDGTRPAVDVADLFKTINAIYSPTGIQFVVDNVVDLDVFGNAYRDCISLDIPAELESLRSKRWGSIVPGRINVYFVRYSRQATATSGIMAITTNRGNFSLLSLNQPAIFINVEGLLDPTGTTVVASRFSSKQYLANDLAHELGHFLTLSHYGAVNSPGRPDSYARRNLMHPNNLLNNTANPLLQDCGYGQLSGQDHRGCAITMKQHNLYPSAAAVSGLTPWSMTSQDSQAAIARMQINQSPGRPVNIALY